MLQNLCRISAEFLRQMSVLLSLSCGRQRLPACYQLNAGLCVKVMQDLACRPLGGRAKKSSAPTVMRRWMVVSITQLSPHDKLTGLISQGQWQAALELAAQHQLSTDDIYKSVSALNISQWT